MQRAKTTKKVVLRLECTQCKTKAQVGSPTSTPYETAADTL
jgi:ribosomal protein L44E